MKGTKAAGTSRERQVKGLLEEKGWVVVRSPASGSPVDLWAMIDPAYGRTHFASAWEGGSLALQIKANTGSPYKNFSPSERAGLRAIAAKAGATPILVHWPPRGECRWISATEWPKGTT